VSGPLLSPPHGPTTLEPSMLSRAHISGNLISGGAVGSGFSRWPHMALQRCP
jgi:hypothetical protein